MSERSNANKTVFVAGATGAIGRQLLPMLIGAGYEVFGTTRNPRKTAQMEVGVRPVVVDVFDRNALIAAVAKAKPDVIIHQLTDLSAADFAATDRLRIDGTRNLVDAAKAAGVRRMIAQSLAIVYLPGPEPATEQDPLADDSPTLGDREGSALARGSCGRTPRVDHPSLRSAVRPGHLVFRNRSFCRRGAAG
jgi:nucleoside-diphosphate-sugar epimerase